MKKMLSLLMLVCLLFGTAFAETWYPFGLTAEDDFQAAKTKVAEALADQEVDDSRFSYTLVKTTAYYLYDIPIAQVLVNRPSGTDWRVMIGSEEMLKQSDQMKAVYALYCKLAEKLGEPSEFFPVIKKTTFEGVEEESVFVTEEAFLSELKKERDVDFTAKFDNCELKIFTSAYRMTVCLYFTK